MAGFFLFLIGLALFCIAFMVYVNEIPTLIEHKMKYNEPQIFNETDKRSNVCDKNRPGKNQLANIVHT